MSDEESKQREKQTLFSLLPFVFYVVMPSFTAVTRNLASHTQKKCRRRCRKEEEAILSLPSPFLFLLYFGFCSRFSKRRIHNTVHVKKEQKNIGTLQGL